MKKEKIEQHIYDLTAEQFENLCVDLLNAEYKFENSISFNKTRENQIDFVGYKGLEKYGFEIKHKYKIDFSTLKKILDPFQSYFDFYHKFILITSANIDRGTIKHFENDKIKIISKNELIELLKKHTSVSERYFSILETKEKKNDRWYKVSLGGILAPIFLFMISTYFDYKDNQKPLENRIENVGKALESIKDLEKYLENVKTDMIKTDLENKKILEEFNKLQGVEDMINEKKESLKIVLEYEPWYKRLFSYFLVFITGISTSILGTILLNKWKLNKSLKN